LPVPFTWLHRNRGNISPDHIFTMGDIVCRISANPFISISPTGPVSERRIRIRMSSSVISHHSSFRWHSSVRLMIYFPQPHPKRRARRVRLATPPVVIQYSDGRRTTGKLQIISVTGGLLRLSKPLVPGALVEVMFLTGVGPILGMAELMNPCSATLRCLQPFRFVAMDNENYSRLRTAIGSSLDKDTPERRGNTTSRPWTMWGSN
jgi:Putative methyltransferase